MTTMLSVWNFLIQTLKNSNAMTKLRWAFLCSIILGSVCSVWAEKEVYLQISRKAGETVTVGSAVYIGYETVDQVFINKGDHWILKVTCQGKGILRCQYTDVDGHTVIVHSPQGRLLEFNRFLFEKTHISLDSYMDSAVKDGNLKGQTSSKLVAISETDSKEHLVEITVEWELNEQGDGSISYYAEVIK